MEDNKVKREQILVSITGVDRPGLTASIMDILAQGNAQILDIGQSDIHSTLCLGILFRIDEQTSGNVMKNLLFKATELGVNIEFEPIGDEEYEKWVDRHPSPHRPSEHRPSAEEHASLCGVLIAWQSPRP